MKLSGRGGRLRLRLDDVEVEILTSLLGELDALFGQDTTGDAADDSATDPVLARLFPDGYADADAAAEFRDLTRSGLRDDRVGRCRACLADLVAAGEVDLTDPAVATRWIQVLNDLRLALGTRLGVGAEDAEVDEAALPADQPHLIYGWLTAVQDRIVTAMTG